LMKTVAGSRVKAEAMPAARMTAGTILIVRTIAASLISNHSTTK
jgi:hypothetical protein